LITIAAAALLVLVVLFFSGAFDLASRAQHTEQASATR